MWDHWNGESYFTVTRVDFTSPSHGKVWGVKTWRGKTDPVEHRIPGAAKKEWVLAEPSRELVSTHFYATANFVLLAFRSQQIIAHVRLRRN